MSLVRFSNAESITVNAEATREWRLPLTGTVGSATIVIPWTSPAASADYIDDAGGSRIRIFSEDSSGVWDGFVTAATWDNENRQVQIRAIQNFGILNRYTVEVNRVFRSVSVGVIVQAALNNSPLPIAAVAETPPNIENDYWFHGETVWDHIQNLQERSSGELRCNSDGELVWGGPVAPLYGTFLSTSGRLRGARYRADFRDQVSQVIALANFSEELAWDVSTAASANFPGQAVIKASVTSQQELKALAQVELDRRKDAKVTIVGSVPRDYWDIREGDSVQGYMDFAAFEGRTFLARVVGRTVVAENDLMELDLQVINTPEYIKPLNAQSSDPWGTIRQHRRESNHNFRYMGGQGERLAWGRRST